MSSSPPPDDPPSNIPSIVELPPPDSAPASTLAPYRDGYLRIVRGWYEGLADLTPDHVAAVEGEISDEAAMVRGTTTSASDVLDESLNALVRLDVVAVVSAHAKPMRYGKFRVRYIFDKLFQLEGAVLAQRAQASSWSLAQSELERVTGQGRIVRTKLLQGFERLLRRYPSLTATLTESRGGSKDAPLVSASLESLAALLDAWLQLPDFALRLESVSFGADDLAEARKAMEAIEAQRIRAAQSPAASRDLPATNVIEGRLMTELHELYRALHDGRDTVPTLPRMVLGNTLRRVFVQLRGAPLPDEPEPKPEPEPPPSV